MDINAIEEYVQAMNLAYASGILGLSYNNKVHVNYQLLEELLNEEGDLEVVKRDCVEYPIQVNFTKNSFTYFAVYNAEKYKNTFGGNIDECITTK
ncbi:MULTISPECIES: hypothetical protein [unclassified Bacillus cereus group]|uniref:hypothetical protein n=1 Tax=unclassified Bacillus cereus group TaxID=2750818 RepID=UPI001F580528|nr:MULTISPECIES: hypothetical protein [unclassified Bacillus cereus group]